MLAIIRAKHNLESAGMIPSIAIYVRHAADCPYASDESWKRCNCRKHLRWTWQGKQLRRSAKTRSWTAAEKARRALELQYEAAIAGGAIKNNDEPIAIEQATEAFLAEKIGGRSAQNTLSKYKLTLGRFQDFCTAQGLYFIREITLEHLSNWRVTWNNYYDSSFALRNNQSRVRAFFRYCENARWITYNPARALSAIKIRDEDYEVDPFTEAQVTKIIRTIPRCSDITPVNQQPLRLLMLLQRWSGLSLVDTSCLSRKEVVRTKGSYRIDTRRRKTGTQVNVPVPAWLGRELSKHTGGSDLYFFWTGASTPKSVTSVYDKVYRRVFRAASIPDGSSHRVRHRFAVALLEEGVDIRVVSRLLGHKSLQTTERFYAKWSTKQQSTLESEVRRAWAAKPAAP